MIRPFLRSIFYFLIGANVSGFEPGIAVIPDTTNRNLPIMPDLPDEPTVMVVRNLNRQFINAEYCE
jgi:hypothetical protein